MIRFPHAKINLGLKVCGKRADGYHEILSVLYPVGLCDILEIIPSNEGPGEAQLEVSGDPQHRAIENDLLLQAYQALPEGTRSYTPRIHLHKRIPIGAGLGGGSSDAAQLFRHFAGAGPNPFDEKDPIAKAAGQIGSDIPFFLQDRAALVSGRGERMTPLDLDLGGWKLLLLVPPYRVSTAEAYKGASSSGPPFPQELSALPVKEWKASLKNELESSVFRKHPELQKLRDHLYKAGASYASMTGSGSGVFGLFRDEAPQIPNTEDHFEWREELPPLT